MAVPIDIIIKLRGGFWNSPLQLCANKPLSFLTWHICDVCAHVEVFSSNKTILFQSSSQSITSPFNPLLNADLLLVLDLIRTKQTLHSYKTNHKISHVLVWWPNLKLTQAVDIIWVLVYYYKPWCNGWVWVEVEVLIIQVLKWIFN